jgi:hypothetical protein
VGVGNGPVGEPLELEPDDLVEIVEVRRSDPRAEPESEPRLHKVSDSAPPGDVTEMRDFKGLARVIDRTAVPKRVRIEMVTAPLSSAAVDVLRHVDGTSNVAKIIKASGLSEDEATAGLQQLFELGVIAFL